MRYINRRKFLGTSLTAIGLPYVIPSSALGNAMRPSPSNRLTCACIGVGGMGTQNMNAFASYDEVQVVAVCDVDQILLDRAKEAIDQRYGNQDCAAYKDFRKIIERPDIDFVVVSTPDHWHAIPSVWAIRSGKDVYTEKPLGLTIEEGKVMVQAARRYGAVVQTGTLQRSLNTFTRGIRLVHSGAIGKVSRVRVGIPGSPEGPVVEPEPVPDHFDFDLWLGQAPHVPYHPARTHSAFRMIYDYSGGGLCDWGAHHIDAAQWGIKKDDTGPVSFEGSGTFPSDGIYDTALTYDFQCTYADGTVMHLSTDHSKCPWGVTFEGEHGKVSITRASLDVEPAHLLREALEEERMLQMWVSGSHVDDFIDCIRTRHETAAPYRTAHRSLSIAHICNIMMRLGQHKAQWDPDPERFVNNAEANRMLSRSMRSPWRL